MVFLLAALQAAFPGAEGFGASASGGRGGRVIAVTTLADRGPGSLRAALDQDGPRTIVFRVAGIIDLRSNLKITKPRVTIAGQTAPGGGVCLRGAGLTISADEVIVRHLRLRPGDRVEGDALCVLGVKNVIIDHCSASWAVDETVSVSGAGGDGITVQWSLITESLNNSVHAKGEHGYGSLIRANGRVSFHHNLYAHHNSRNPRPGTYGDGRLQLDFRNNVVYNWGSRAGYSAEDPALVGLVANYYKPGPSTRRRKEIFRIGGETTALWAEGNALEGVDVPSIAGTLLKEAPPVAPVTTDSAEEAYRKVLAAAGAVPRDAVDARVAGEVEKGGGRIIDSPKDVGGWPELAAGEAPADEDGDGLPDEWETKHGFDPKDGSDGPKDADGDGWTDLEEYLNGTEPR